MWHSYHPYHGIEMWQNYPSFQLFLRLSGFCYVVAMDSSSSCSRAFQFWDSVNDSAQYCAMMNTVTIDTIGISSSFS